MSAERHMHQFYEVAAAAAAGNSRSYTFYDNNARRGVELFVMNYLEDYYGAMIGSYTPASKITLGAHQHELWGIGVDLDS